VKTTLLLILGCALFVILIPSQAHVHKLISLISNNISWKFFFGVNVLIFFQLIFRTIRFKCLLNLLFSRQITFLKSFNLTSASYFVALATPNKSGDMIRGALSESNRLETLAISVNEYILDVLLVIFTPLSVFLIDYSLYQKNIITGYVIICLSLVLFLIFIVKVRWDKILIRFSLYQKHREKIKTTIKFFLEFHKNKLAMITGLVLTFFSYALYFIAFYLVLKKLGADITFLQTVVAASCAVFLGAISFVPMGMGTRDASSFALLTLMGVPAEIAASAVVVVRSLSLTLLLTGGLCYSWIIIKNNQKRGGTPHVQ
jgi:uncharacterized protein (TIRG00374 family)